MKNWCSVVLVSVCSIAGSAWAGGVRAERHPWARWKPGTWVETEIDPVSSGKMLSRETLLEAGDDVVRLHRKMTMSGPQGPVETEDGMVVGYAFMGGAHLAPDRERVGTETLVVGGRRYECTIWRAEGRLDRDRSIEQAWVAAGVEHPLRIVSKFERFELTLDLVRLDDSYRVGRRRVACARYEGKMVSGEHESDVYQLRSSEVPGGILRNEIRSSLPDGSIGVHSNTVVDYETR